MGPATVAKVVPLYKHAMRYMKLLPRLAQGTLVGRDRNDGARHRVGPASGEFPRKRQ
ncbi:hypothetical protein [Paenibacillus sp. R14(2021)]|uniref:hypothetical protein n=1 Tax=Paenibacillus sp. R14(2021) TaxID=2859228 RepID=UPI0035BE1C7F